MTDTDRQIAATVHRIQAGQRWPQIVLARRAMWDQDNAGYWFPVTRLTDTHTAARRAVSVYNA